VSQDVTVLLLGSGGREHAIAWKLAQSPRLKNLYAAPGSDAIARWAQCLAIDPTDSAAVVKAAKEVHAKLVVIGPEAPLAAGVADALRKEGFAVFGPNKDAARLETSKAFAKDFMKRHGVPTARYEVHDDIAKARAALTKWTGGVVVKADGLAAGKGVFVCSSKDEALAAVAALMERGDFGAAGRRVVLEELLEGPEVSVLVLLDGRTSQPLPPSQDHKRLKDGDKGPNTGGMGAYTLSRASAREILEKVSPLAVKVQAGLHKDGFDYRGVLYLGLMLTASGPKMLEFNCRFGDPETQSILPALDSDLLTLMTQCAEGKLSTKVSWGERSCVGVTLASAGYPEKADSGREIEGLDALPDGALVFHAGTKLDGGRWLSAGGRVLTVCGIGPDVAGARENAYAAVAKIRFPGMQHRRDIGAKELVTA
jgi:phosphoribosylamine---glycine ligase